MPPTALSPCSALISPSADGRHVFAAHFGADALEVSIEDDGAGAASAAGSVGHGLRGMRERAAMLGGAVSARPGEQGGYRVCAVLPYPEPQ